MYYDFYSGLLEISGGIFGCHVDQGTLQATSGQGARDAEQSIPRNEELST